MTRFPNVRDRFNSADYKIKLIEPWSSSKTPVVLSYGMGRDSTVILHRWLTDPSTRDFDLDQLVVVTAMTGDEWAEDTGRLVQSHMLPLMAANKVRFIQLARRGKFREDGVAILNDSTEPQQLHLAGCYPLSAEMIAAGTLPESSEGKRKCSIKTKGLPIDTVVAQLLGGTLKNSKMVGCRDYRHVIGFNADEMKRVERDGCYGSAARTPEFPLVVWGWGHEKVREYADQIAGEPWPKSCCTFCPFTRGRDEVLARFRCWPAHGAFVLMMEHLCLAFNPKMPLYANKSCLKVCEKNNLTEVLRLFRERLAREEHALYRVRRCRPGKAWHRSIEQVLKGTRDRCTQALTERATDAGVDVQCEQDDARTLRAYLRNRRGVKVGTEAEDMLVVAPALTPDKTGPGFEKHWRHSLQLLTV